MAKNMAMIDGDVVSNIVWCSDNTPETDNLKNISGRPIVIGDTYADGKWYRNGIEIQTYLESMMLEIEYMHAENEELLSDLAAMVDVVYESDLERIEA